MMRVADKYGHYDLIEFWGDKMARNDFFTKQDQFFRNLSYVDIIDKALYDARTFAKYSLDMGLSKKDITLGCVLAARIGTGNKTELNFYEKRLIDKVMEMFGWNQNDITNVVYPEVASRVSETNYESLLWLSLDSKLSAPFLSLILDFAYIDNVVDENVMDRIDEIFFGNTDKNTESDKNSLKNTESGLTRLQLQNDEIKKEMLRVLRKSGRPHTVNELSDICKRSSAKIQSLLQRLCEAGKVKEIFLDESETTKAYIINDSI